MSRRATERSDGRFAHVQAAWPQVEPRPPIPADLERRIDLQVAGRRAFGVDLGPRDAPSVLLVHGLGSLAEEIASALSTKLLAAGFRVIAIDRPGYGHSDPAPVGEAGPAAQGRWLSSVLLALDVRLSVIVGHSFGAAVALCMTSAAEGRPALILVSPFCRPTPPAAAPLLRLAVDRTTGPFVRHKLLPAVAERLVRWRLAQAFAPDPVPSGLRALPSSIMTQESAILAMAGELRSYNGDVGQLPAVSSGRRRRVVVFSGAQDRVVPACSHGDWLKTFMPGLEHLVVPGGHMLHHTRAEAVVEAARRCA